MNIILIGFMGSGKTTIGRKLAQRLGYYFMDMDLQIEEEQGCSIADIFKYGGEAVFRKLETQLLKRLKSVQNTVISTGGGVVTAPENINLMQAIGKLIYLKVPQEELMNRLRNDTSRPLLGTENAEEKINTLLMEREPLYQKADHTIEPHDFSPHSIVSQIIQIL